MLHRVRRRQRVGARASDHKMTNAAACNSSIFDVDELLLMTTDGWTPPGGGPAGAQVVNKTIVEPTTVLC